MLLIKKIPFDLVVFMGTAFMIVFLGTVIVRCDKISNCRSNYYRYDDIEVHIHDDYHDYDVKKSVHKVKHNRNDSLCWVKRFILKRIVVVLGNY
jgi:hypothetical protein